MIRHPMVRKIGCVAMVAAVMFPLGRALFPFLSEAIGEVPFGVFEAVFTTTLGFALEAVLFG